MNWEKIKKAFAVKPLTPEQQYKRVKGEFHFRLLGIPGPMVLFFLIYSAHDTIDPNHLFNLPLFGIVSWVELQHLGVLITGCITIYRIVQLVRSYFFVVNFRPEPVRA